MGFISKIFGGGGAKAAGQAAAVQSTATDKAVAEQKRQFNLVREDLAPFKEAGTRALPGLEGLITDPLQQKAFIEDNPFFDALTERSTRTIFNNAAARGKVGSGGTAEALQNSFLLLGSNLVNQNINQRFGLSDIGQSAAAQTGRFGAQSAGNISNLITNQGNADAAGIVGAAQNRANSTSSFINTALGIAGLFDPIKLSDIRFKEDLKKIGKDEHGLNVYTYKYKGDDKTRIGNMAQEVEKEFPNAVKTIANIKFIDYEELNGIAELHKAA